MMAVAGMSRATVQVLKAAHSQAIRTGFGHPAPEHILIALVESDVLSLKTRERSKLISAIEDRLRTRRSPGARPDRRSVRRTNDVCRVAIRTAGAAGQRRAEPPDLLHGIVELEPELAELLGESESGRQVAVRPLALDSPTPMQVWYLKSDFSKDEPIYEQIISQIEEAIATGRLTEGERLPSVRDLASELDVAPGTVARAYSDLESRGLVTTNRSAGTRVASNQRLGLDAQGHTYLVGLLRPIVITARNLGADREELGKALDDAMHGVMEVPGS